MTRLSIIILLSLCSRYADGQVEPNNKNATDAPVDTFYQKRYAFISSNWNELILIDTIKNSKDTVLVNFKNSKGFIRQHINIKNDTGCIRESLTKYIDNRQLLIYSEHWNFACQNTDPKDYDGILDTYRRFTYDNMKRKISEFVMNISTKTWRYDYLYDEKGDQYTKSNRITRNEFWQE